MNQNNNASCLYLLLLLAAAALALIAVPSLFDSLVGWKAVILAGLGAFALMNLWFIRHRFPAAVFPWIYALAVFWVVSLAANAQHLRRMENMVQVLTFKDRQPWTFGHTLGLSFAIFVMVALWKREDSDEEPEPTDSEEVISGPRLISHEQALVLAAERSQANERRIFWAGVELPESCGTEHFAIVGTPGSGKTLSLHLLMKTVLPRIGMGLNRRAVIYDAKRDTCSFLAGVFRGQSRQPPVHVMNPFDLRASPWAMNQDICEGATAHEIASILITKSGSESQPFFLDASRALLGGVMHSFSQLAPDTWTLRDVVLTMRYTKRITAVIAACSQTEYLLSKYVTGAARDNDIEATIETFMRGFSFVAAAWHHSTRPPVSLEQWMQSESILVLGADPKFDHILQSLNRAIFKRIVELTRRLPDLHSNEQRQAWFIIDELRNAGNLEDLDKLLVEGRSKGACVVLGFQDLAGLRLVYGDKRADEIIGACANKVFLQNGDQTTIDYATKHFKSQEVIETRVSQSKSESTGNFGGGTEGHSVSRQRVTRPVVHEGLLKSLSKPSPGRAGLMGYCDTAAVGTEFPYLMTLPSDFLTANLPKPDPNEASFEPRPREHLELPEWDITDLKRLNLERFPELLSLGDYKPKPPFPEVSQDDDEDEPPSHEIFGLK